MCGIFGFCGQTNRVSTLIKGLKSLEYRGYDSAGLAFINKNNKIELHKKSGKVSELEKSVNLKAVFNIGISHTRWATHGKATENNAHPHISYKKNFCIVHNGIIENYEELYKKYLKNVKLSSETDTEIIAHLLEKFYQNNVVETLQKVCELIKGSYAFAVISTYEPNKIFLAKKSSPLMFGEGKKGLFFSSDINTLNLFCNKIFKLEDDDFVMLESGKYQIINSNKTRQCEAMKFCNISKKKRAVKCYMEQEIAESEQAIWATASAFNCQFEKIPKKFFSCPDKIYLVACGTAFHSCLIGKKYLEAHFSAPILCEIASEFIYSNPKITKNTICIFVSQSGETADTLISLKLAKEMGAKVLAITNNENSTITLDSQYTIIMQAGWEKAVASTKAYVCQLAVFYLIGYALNKNLETAMANLKQLCEQIKTFNYTKWAKTASKNLVKFEKIIFIGRQLSYITAMEASLKLKEITYINSIACASGELKHGTLALVDNKTLVVAILCEYDLINKNSSTLKEISARNGNLLVLSPFEENGELSNSNNLFLPTVSNDLYPIISILPLQKLACEISLSLSLNPDMPKNLSKSVTVE